ncbi:MAG TPA: transglycosylase SLT domain-containing protein [Anaerolineales bacterium]|nr:transglycosylase SLT domain-containing protein [Anaerolineales bacterium]
MGSGPGLVFRGLFIGIFAVIALTNAVTTGATTSASSNEPIVNDAVQQSFGQSAAVSPTPDVQVAEVGCQVSGKFPAKITQWCGMITNHAHKNGLEPDLVAALIWQESGGDKSAYSRSGAVGLMQVMPRDGIAASFNCINGPCFKNRPTISELEDPEFNVKYGTRMLSQLVNRNGNIRDALKAYGPMNVGYSYADKVLSLYRQYGK